jgi:hypothetical protein
MKFFRRRDLGRPSVSFGKNEKWGAFAVRRPPAPYLGRNVLAKSSSKTAGQGKPQGLSRKYRSGCVKNIVNIWIDGQAIASVYPSLGTELNWATPGQDLGSESVS